MIRHGPAYLTAPARWQKRGVTVKRDWGWVELLTAVTTSPRGRGHLFAVEVGQDGSWLAQLDSVRLRGDRGALAPGTYIARFEQGDEYQHVSVHVRDCVIQVRGEDQELPSVALDLADGE